TQMKAEISQIRDELGLIKKRINESRKQISNKYLRKNEIEIHLKPDTNPIENSDIRRLEKAKLDRDEALAVYNTSKKDEQEIL
ncbi:MAG: hypothetical protein K1W22_03845, partial [Lachnospiraceae bacterium]